MRILRSLLLLLAVGNCLAADLTVQVTDPRSAPVAGARVELYPSSGTKPITIQNTAGDGSARFANLAEGEYRLETLAPGFARATTGVRLPQGIAVKVALAVAGPSETVVVSATRTPVPVGESGSRVALLDETQLETMQPITVSDALRFMPGNVVNQAGQFGGQASLFVRGGESRYNKVIIDGVPVNEPGGTFDFGVVPLTRVERMEVVRGAESVLYGSDAMTSVVTISSATGHTPTPELILGADGGTFGTARGYAALSGARGRFDYNFFGQQDATDGQGVNDEYSNSAQGANIGIAITPKAFVRVRARHQNSRTGVQNQWVFLGQPLLAPDIDQFARQNNFLGSAELTLAAPARWQHRFAIYEYNHKGTNQDNIADRGCDVAAFNFFDCFFSSPFKVNRAGFTYQGDYSPRSWARMTFGYEFEDENGSFHSDFASLDLLGNPAIGNSNVRGLRRNHAVFVQPMITRGRLTARAGFRYVHNESFGDKVVPQAALSVVARQGGEALGTTRFTVSYAQAIKEPRFEETFGISGSFPANPNPDLRPEQNRAFEAGVSQGFGRGRHVLTATYFNNLFRDQIQFDFLANQYFNVAKSIAHGAEVEWHSRITSKLALTGAYVYTSSQVLDNPGGSPPFATGQALLRRPRHSGSLLLNYSSRKWGGEVAGAFVGRRLDSDFLFGAVPPVDHSPGYARVDLGGWYAVHPRLTLYANVYNALNHHYEEVVGYPALKANFRAGMRFRIGGE